MRIAILGGGPAGCTLATLLAHAGMDAVVFDDGERAGMLVGESLVPAVVPLLRRLGIEDDVAAIGIRKPGVSFVFSETSVFPFSFLPIGDRCAPYAYNVPRPGFDRVLSRAAKAAGVRFVTGKVTCEHSSDRVTLPDGRIDAVPEWRNRQPDLVVDATGRRRTLARLLDVPASVGPRRDVAHFAHYEGFAQEDPPGQVEITRLSAGWSWRIPLRGRMSFGIVLDRHAAADLGTDASARLAAALRSHQILARTAEEARPVSPAHTYANYQLITHRGFGKNWVMIGDAYGFVDPMLSPGVHVAMHSAELLARHLTDGNTPRALARYSRDMNDLLHAWQELIETFYSGRIFAIHRMGSAIRRHWNNPVSAAMERHTIEHLALLASGVRTRSHYSRGVLKTLSTLSRFGPSSETFRIA